MTLPKAPIGFYWQKITEAPIGFFWQKIIEWHWPLSKWHWIPSPKVKIGIDERYVSITRQWGPLLIVYKTRKEGE